MPELYLSKRLKRDEGVTARNNLSFMIRRHEYVSKSFELDDLLEQCRESGGAFSLINYAMYLVSINEWGDADSQFKRIRYSDPEIEESINWWKRLYDQGDCEGSLVLGWLLKYGFYEDDKRLVSDYFWDAKKYYEDMPNFCILRPIQIRNMMSNTNYMRQNSYL